MRRREGGREEGRSEGGGREEGGSEGGNKTRRRLDWLQELLYTLMGIPSSTAGGTRFRAAINSSF